MLTLRRTHTSTQDKDTHINTNMLIQRHTHTETDRQTHTKTDTDTHAKTEGPTLRHAYTHTMTD